MRLIIKGGIISRAEEGWLISLNGARTSNGGKALYSPKGQVELSSNARVAQHLEGKEP